MFPLLFPAVVLSSFLGFFFNSVAREQRKVLTSFDFFRAEQSGCCRAGSENSGWVELYPRAKGGPLNQFCVQYVEYIPWIILENDLKFRHEGHGICSYDEMRISSLEYMKYLE